MISEEMKKRAKNDEDRRLEEWADQIRLIVARANGEEVDIKLIEHEMPEVLPTEDEMITLPPPPRPRRLPKPSERAST